MYLVSNSERFVLLQSRSTTDLVVSFELTFNKML